MKNRVLLIFSFSAFWVLISVLSAISKEASAPAIFFEENVFDAKEIKKADSLEHTFKVYNKGDGVLEISEVQTS